MKVLIPKYLVDENGEKYQLFLEYRLNSKENWVWIISYVGDHGILYHNESSYYNAVSNDLLCNFLSNRKLKHIY